MPALDGRAVPCAHRRWGESWPLVPRDAGAVKKRAGVGKPTVSSCVGFSCSPQPDLSPHSLNCWPGNSWIWCRPTLTSKRSNTLDSLLSMTREFHLSSVPFFDLKKSTFDLNMKITSEKRSNVCLFVLLCLSFCPLHWNPLSGYVCLSLCPLSTCLQGPVQMAAARPEGSWAWLLQEVWAYRTQLPGQVRKSWQFSYL